MRTITPSPTPLQEPGGTLRQTYSTPGTYSFTTPAGYSGVIFRVFGAGGPGGSGVQSCCGGGGGGGGACNASFCTNPGHFGANGKVQIYY